MSENKQELDRDTIAKERAAYLRGDVPAKTKEELHEELIEAIKEYNLEDQIEVVEKAYRLADEAHKEQRRKSGEPYIIHPISVAIILTKLEMDIDTIIAGLLHDVIEDTEMEYEDVAREFSEEVAVLVDGVTKLTQLNYSSDKVEIQAENLRKMFLAMAKDIRVIIIKLADRLHNMRTLQHMKPEKQKEKSRETLEIYAPLAERLGISRIKVELDDLALKYLEPKIFNELYSDIEKTKGEKEDFISSIVEEVRNHVSDAKIEARVRGRVKHYFSIYKKMVNQNKTLDQIYDLFAVRIIVKDLKDCYTALGVIHDIYTPIPGRIKDYIAMPKQNKYQSLHTTVITSDGQQFEVQIRTEDMHRIAEYGIAAHWKYKAGQNGKEQKASQQEEAKLAWLRQILEWQKEMSDNTEFLTLLKSDLNLFSEWVYCFTPGGDVKTLPTGSTPIDFAYSIHSAIGNRMVGARVNGKLVNIDYQIKNGDRIEIITSQNSRGPSMDWLKLVKSTQAKNKINQWFKTARKEDNIIKGKEMLNVYCKNKGISLGELLKNEYLEKTMRKYGFKDIDAMYAAVGHGGLKEGQVINKLLDEHNKEKSRAITDATVLEAFASKPKALEGVRLPRKLKGDVLVKGMTGVATRMSKCCSPVPGDEIIGFITRGRGVTVHRTDCVNVMNLTEFERERLVETEWIAKAGTSESKDLFTAEIQIYAYNKSGVLLAISKIFTENKVDVSSMNVRTSKSGTATVNVSFDIGGKEQLLGIIAKLRNVDNVIDVERNRG